MSLKRFSFRRALLIFAPLASIYSDLNIQCGIMDPDSSSSHDPRYCISKYTKPLKISSPGLPPPSSFLSMLARRKKFCLFFLDLGGFFLLVILLISALLQVEGAAKQMSQQNFYPNAQAGLSTLLWDLTLSIDPPKRDPTTQRRFKLHSKKRSIDLGSKSSATLRNGSLTSLVENAVFRQRCGTG